MKINWNNMLDASCADVDAVLLLENVKFHHYTNEDRHIGFNTETTLAVLNVVWLFDDKIMIMNVNLNIIIY